MEGLTHAADNIPKLLQRAQDDRYGTSGESDESQHQKQGSKPPMSIHAFSALEYYSTTIKKGNRGGDDALRPSARAERDAQKIMKAHYQQTERERIVKLYEESDKSHGTIKKIARQENVAYATVKTWIHRAKDNDE